MINEAFHGKRKGFTLAELLVVIAIIGILFVMVLPSLNSITGQSKLKGSSNAVHAAAKLARQYAITHNQPTYLVFNEGQTDSNLAYRAYAVFTINIHTNPVEQSAGYFLTDWEQLPVGIVFNNETSSGQNNIFVLGSNAWDGGFNRDNRIYIQPHTFITVGFKPRGTIQRNYDFDIHLAEGIYENGLLARTSNQGQRIRIDGLGQSHITPLFYNEDGEPREIDEP